MDLSLLYSSDPDLLSKRSIGISAECQVVGQDQIGKAVPIAEKLFGFFGFIKGNSDVFGFHISKRNSIPGDDEIRGSTFDPARFVRGLDV